MPPAENSIGVIGGMGPAAAIEFCRLLLELDPAETDQDHLRVILDNNTKIPNRSDFLLGGPLDPADEIARTARNLVSAGAGVLAMPCNTAHSWIDTVRSAVDVPTPSIITETAAECLRSVPGLDSVGLLASRGTIGAGLYQDAFGDRAAVLVPTDASQELVSKAISEVKAGRIDSARQLLSEVSRELIAGGAAAIIAGCTEVPLALSPDDIEVPLIDSMVALARATVALARGTEHGTASS